MMAATRKKATGLDGAAVLRAQLADPEVRHAFEQRRLIHEVAIAVRGMRASAGITQAELARRIGTSQPTIARLERGLDVRTPRWDTLQRIARALGRQLKLRFEPRGGAETLVEVARGPPARKSGAPAR
jgi:DNA-binding XRE family transcriptional regulator